ncbi:FHA domain-containing protein [Gordonia rubripertincta]|uniref:FHA domain-containing protein n=2 Tax=Gordonia rubripertincta TaxID=36822 RepID=A0AAW6R8D2_GORRU|nr:FHA domain-containing protein [Gordonia rubripertincta]MDG6780405.1 FHA domain-containing protein [Gordonia rubripertincta]NKY64208.1 FHA domain-containing protein [Gordonia rubripertincta]
MTIPGDIPSVTPTVTLIPGAGIVIRKPAFLCLISDTVPAAFITDLLDVESAVSVPDSAPRRGRHLVRALAQLVLTADEQIDIAFAAPDNVGIAIFMSGRVYGETDGKRIEPPPGDTYDKAIPWPSEGLGLYLEGTVPAEVGEERFDLVDGVVPASGTLLHTPLGLRGTEFHPLPVSTQAPAPEPEPEPAREPERKPEPAASADPFADFPSRSASPPLPVPEPDPMGTTERMRPDVAEPLPFTSTPLGGTPVGQPEPLPTDPMPAAHAAQPNPFAEPLEPRAPLPKEEHQRPATEVVKIEASRAKVHGIRCSRGHLNHPQSWLCGVCGIRMDQLTTFLVEGERPPLGWLLLDNGFTFLLDEDLVIGREPGSSGGGRAGSPKPIRVQDETGQLSRRHVEIRLVEWTVQLVDLGSANGTFVADPSSGNREVRLLPHRPHVLVPGSHVRIGGRHFIFESHHARI